jgi:hypothetical protein
MKLLRKLNQQEQLINSLLIEINRQKVDWNTAEQIESLYIEIGGDLTFVKN